MTTRRGFLTGMLALGAAPAIVRAESLMRLWVPPQDVLTLDMLRNISRQLRANAFPDEGVYYTVMHPSMGEMVREQLLTGTGFGHVKVLYRGEVGRYG